eukprot:SAG31_NODE_24585_length_478_cov_1.073879_1_plen_118_part_10
MLWQRKASANHTQQKPSEQLLQTVPNCANGGDAAVWRQNPMLRHRYSRSASHAAQVWDPSGAEIEKARVHILENSWEVMLSHHRIETMATTRTLFESLRSRGVNVFWDVECDPAQILG